MAQSHDLGRDAEALAARYLELRGWTVLERNWRVGHREVDLIAQRADVVAFVEVKARRTRSFGHPLDAITRAKRRDLELAARAWVARHPRAGQYRFDAIWVIGDPARGPCEIDHAPGAWRL